MTKNLFITSLLFLCLGQLNAQILDFASKSENEKIALLSRDLHPATFKIPDGTSTFTVNGSGTEIATYNPSSKTINFYNLQSGEMKKSLQLEDPCYSNLAFSKTSKYLSYSSGKKVYVIDAQTYAKVLDLNPKLDKASVLLFGTTDDVLAVKSVNDEGDKSGVALYSISKDTRIFYNVETDLITHLAFTSDGRFLKSMYLYDTSSGKEINKLPYSNTLGFTADGSNLLSLDANGDIQFLNTVSLVEQKKIETKHAAKVNGAVLSTDNKLMATCSDDKHIKLFDLQTNQPICTLLAHEGVVENIEYLNEINSIVSWSLNEKSVKVWDASTEKLVFFNAKYKANKTDITNYLATYPNGQFADLSKHYIDTLDYDLANKTRTIAAYKLYLTQQPTGVYAANANLAIEDLFFQSAKDSSKISGYKSYLSTYPSGRYKVVAENSIDSLNFKIAEKAHTIDAYQTYLKTYPNGLYLQNANNGIDDVTYETAASGLSIFYLTDYLAKFPNGKHVVDAQNKIRTLSFEIDKKGYETIDKQLDAIAIYLSTCNTPLYKEKALARLKTLLGQTNETQLSTPSPNQYNQTNNNQQNYQQQDNPNQQNYQQPNQQNYQQQVNPNQQNYQQPNQQQVNPNQQNYQQPNQQQVNPNQQNYQQSNQQNYQQQPVNPHTQPTGQQINNQPLPSESNQPSDLDQEVNVIQPTDSIR